MNGDDGIAGDNFDELADGNPLILETLMQMQSGALERSGRDEQTYWLVRIAALVAMDAAPISYLLNLDAAEDLGVAPEQIAGTLVAIAPVIGSARTVSAASKMVRAGILGEAMAAELEMEPDEEI
jgi:4-carboxymuconolactone decarboxylase